MIIPIRTLGDPVLKTPAKLVERFDDALRLLSENMLETMYDAPGVGLAGPQIGISLRLFVFDDGVTGPMFMANPELLSGEGEIVEEEGNPDLAEADFAKAREIRAAATKK